jgi:NADH-quinone oxidoreductase subunit L
MPITWITALLGSLALIGTPLFSGFYSKDEVIMAVKASQLYGSGFAYFAVMAGVFVTAFYSFRMYFLVFHGKERFDQNPDAHHDDHGHQDHGHSHKPHESPWVVIAPLVLLAIPSVFLGFMTIQPMLFGDFFKDAIFVDGTKHTAMQELAKEFHGAAQLALHGLMTLPFWLALSGVALSYYMYIINPALPAAIKARVEPIYSLLENKYYMDWFYENVLARGARMLGTGLWKGGDQTLIDGGIVNGSWKLVGWVSGLVRRAQTGYLYHYALVMILGLFVLLTYFVVFNK